MTSIPALGGGRGYLCSLASLVYIANSRLVRANETPDRVAEEKWKQGSKERREGRKTDKSRREDAVLI